MKTILNRIGAIRLTPHRFFGTMVLVAIAISALLMSSCSDDLDG